MKLQELEERDKNQYIKATLERGSFLRKINVWSSSDIHYEQWLSNFADLNDRYVAAKILSNFLFYPKTMIAKLLHDSVGNAVSEIALKTSNTNADFYKREIYYSYVPGENPKPTDSGCMFMRKLRDELHINESQLLGFEDLRKLLQKEGTTRQFQIVLCDDFVGSGCQCCCALCENLLDGDKSIYDFSQKYGHTIAYAPLIANRKGFDLIKQRIPKLIFTPAHVLGDEYNLFSEKCLCWEGDQDLYDAGVGLIRRTSAKLGILDDNKVMSVRGFGGQGLFIGFEHGIPDSDPAFFFYNSKGWKPLMERYYERD